MTSLSPDTGSEERAQPSSESDSSSVTPAECSLLQVPYPGRSHATSHPRTSSTIQREALSPGKAPARPRSHALYRLSLSPSTVPSFVLRFLSLFSQCCECTCVVLCGWCAWQRCVHVEPTWFDFRCWKLESFKTMQSIHLHFIFAFVCPYEGVCGEISWRFNHHSGRNWKNKTKQKNDAATRETQSQSHRHASF